MIDTQKWIDNFNLQLPHINMAYDSFFSKGKIEDYFEIKIDTATGLPAIYISDSKELPKLIEDELSDAFNNAKPAEIRMDKTNFK